MEIFTTTPLLDCHPLTREFTTVPSRPGIYGFRYIDQEARMIQIVRPRHNIRIRQLE